MTYALVIAGFTLFAGVDADVCSMLKAQALYELPSIAASEIVCVPQKDV